MANFTKKTEKSADFAKGGNTPMFGHGDRTTTAPSDAAGSQKPGVTEHDPKGGSGDKFAKGGSGKMFGYSGAVPAQAGITGAR
jgi:hypothetical protein